MVPPSDLPVHNPLDHSDHVHHDSPSHIAMTGHDFSPEDLHDLLDGVYDPNEHNPEADSTADDSCNNTNSCVSSSAAAALAPEPASSVASVQGSISAKDKAAARTERKRSREKQRRSDVNKQFSELTGTLKRIERERDGTVYAGSVTNRADLIARTIVLMNTMHESCKKHKTEVEQLQKDLEEAKKAGEETAAKLKESMTAPQNMGAGKFMMMVPMMVGGNGDQGMPFGAAAAHMPFWMPPPGAAAANPTPLSSQHPIPAPAAPTPAASSTAAPEPQGSATTTTAASSSTLMNQHVQSMQYMMQPPWMNMFSAPTAAAMMQAAAAAPNSNNNEDKKQDANKGGGNLAHCA